MPVLCIGVLLWTATSAAAAEVSLLHADATTVRIAAPAAPRDGEVLQVQFQANGKLHTLNLRPNELGALTSRLDESGMATAYTGDVAGLAGSWVAVTRTGSHWSGMWYDGGEHYAIDRAGALASASRIAALMNPDQPMVFRLRDVVWEDLSLENDTRHPAITGEEIAAGMGAAALAPVSAGRPARRLGMTVVADAVLAQRHGDQVEGMLLAQINMVDALFTSQLGVRVMADEVIVFDRVAGSPFSTTTDPDRLLDEVAAWRAQTASQRETGLTHLFTGRNLNGRIVGMAFLNSVCGRRFAASLSEATLATTLSALIAAHEIGHVFGAPHDGERGSACAATPTDYLMAPRINGSQEFSACSVQQMEPQIETASCLNTWRSSDIFPPHERPRPQGGGGALPLWQLALLGMLVSARGRRRAQMRANQSAR